MISPYLDPAKVADEQPYKAVSGISNGLFFQRTRLLQALNLFDLSSQTCREGAGRLFQFFNFFFGKAGNIVNVFFSIPFFEHIPI